MASKHFNRIIIIRVILISLTSFLVTLSINDWRFLIITGILLISQIASLIYYLNSTNRKISYFFDAVKNEDSTLHFPITSKNKTIKELNSSLNNVNEMIKNVRREIEVQEKNYHLMLEEAETGIMTIDENEHIRFSNKAAKDLLQVETLTHINQFQRIDEDLWQVLKNIESGVKHHIKFQNEKDSYNISLISSNITTHDKNMRLIILQDIKSEMDENETDSWLKLIRVLTHEIMNSITPITTLSETLTEYFTSTTNREEKITEAISGLKVIKEQSRSLLNFVNSYRNLTRLAKPEIRAFDASLLIEKLMVLCQCEQHAKHITFNTQIEPKNQKINGDQEQLSQVLVNIIKNSVEAIPENQKAQIDIKIQQSNNKTLITVKDDGPGISNEIIDDIYTPFFTSKESGTGIGLSLSRQIIKNHKGKIFARSTPGIETVFTLELPFNS